MKSQLVRYYLFSAAIVLLLTAWLFIILQTPFEPIAGAKLITSGKQCKQHANTKQKPSCLDAAEFSTTSLPVFYRDRFQTSHLVLRLRFAVDFDDISEDLMALYLPKISDAVQIHINGHLVANISNPEQPPSRNWNRPVYVSFSNLLVAKENLIEIAVMGYPQDGAGIHPFYFGPASLLEHPYNVRFIATKVTAQIGLTLMVLATILFSVLFFSSSQKKFYGNLAIVSLSAAIFTSHFALTDIPVSYWTWTVTWNIAIHILYCSFYIFISKYVGVPLNNFERRYWILVIIMFAALLFGPSAYVLELAAVLGVATILVGFRGLANLWIARHRLGNATFFCLFGLFTMGIAISFHDWVFMFVRPTPIHLHIGQFALPIIMSVSIWMIINDLIKSATDNDQLNIALQMKVNETSEKLVQSYKELALIERQRLLQEERQRIMLDLHDGVGGQLVNTLAYMETQAATDPAVQSSLEGILRDLSLMVDGLEAHDSLTTALGMLRSRLEPLLNKTDMSFDWQVRDEPVTPSAGPSQNLNVLRIAQEAITNAVKHANASVISVETDSASITITDNGNGIDNLNQSNRSGSNSGIGIVGMKDRAEKLGADLVIKSSDKGTAVSLNWDTS